MLEYDNRFLIEDQDVTRQSAEEIVPLVLQFIHPSSVVDVGCGLGTWLKVFKRHGIHDYLGIDGRWIDLELLEIEGSNFVAADLTEPLHLDRRFDLVLCLEVAEHLPTASAEVLVESLAGLGDLILFSAAIPFQGGAHHINEQWPNYWAQLFRSRSFVAVDILRPRVWTNERIMWWYRQNTLLFAHERTLAQRSDLRALGSGWPTEPLPLIHPGNWRPPPSPMTFGRILREFWWRARGLLK